MTFVFWVWRPGVSVSVLLLLCVCDRVEGVIRRHCDCYEEDMYVQKDIGGVLDCSFKPGLGPYAECTEITDLRSGLEEVFPDVRSLCIFHSASSLPADSFSHIPLLEHLWVDGSHLAKVTSGAFAGLPKLRFLYLLFSSTWGGVNVTLDPGVFQGLSSLEELTLAGMSLALAPPALLDPLVGVRRLRVDRAGVRDLGELFCLLSPGMEKLETLDLPNSKVSSIQNGGCSGSNPWPTALLSRIRILDLSGNPVRRVEPKSLAVFQNLSSLSLSMVDVWVGQLWGSGMGRVNKLYLSSYNPRQFTPSLSDLCTLVVKHGVESLALHMALITAFTAEVMKRCGLGLRQLSVSSEDLSGMELGFWTGTGQLQGLMMVLTKLTNASFCSAGGGRVWNLTSLILHDNHLTEITTDQFSCMPLLERLDLSRNHISLLAHRALQGMPLLRVLDLTHNKISLLGEDDFEGLPALEVLLLEGNKISGGIAHGVFRRQHRLQDLSLGEIDIIYELFLNMLFLGFPTKLQHLLIDTGPGTYLTVGHVPAPEVPMVLELRGKMIQSSDCVNNMFPMVRELKVGEGTTFACTSLFLAPYFLNLESFEFSANPEKFGTPYTTINQLRKLKRLKLTNLNFSNHTDPSVTFRNLTELRSLVLINCRLNFLTRSMFTDLVSLRVLRLYSESPLILLEGVFLPLLSLSTLVFDQVDFRCDCSNGWLLDWADNSRKTQVVLLQRQQCIWHYQRLNFLSTMDRLCQTEEDFLSYVSTMTAVCTLLFLALGYRFLRWPCVILFFRLRGWVERRVGRRWWRKRRMGRGQWEELIEGEEGEEEQEEEEVRYDAFVSFSSRDEAWVLGEMAPMLEEEGEPRLRLCLHHRDFEVGKGIVDNIAESIYSSRRTVCVLTRRYLRSDWCGLEMRVATHRLLSEHSHRLILIFLEHISPFELSAFHRLAKLARTRTYLDWPQDEDERVTFWERLRRNIAERDTDELHDPPEAS
ncbi:toll-like receptor 12 [Coregonus clupeaformis]|uniref:toll-like receptor 12 n=1 Tax=Coregonus clupeaformis TaxID=59861 RepID=UPI001BE04819|nr:toll-like receptor 12 [Coregonus clupeaformis]